MRKTILLLTCLLAAFANTQAQTVAQSSDPETLQGLKGVRLVVMLGRAEALEAERRPILQKLLQEDAEAKFAKADIPLLKFAQDLENASGSPTFFLWVTLDKPNGHVFPVVTKSNLLQKARLSRDSSVELSVSTWESGSIGVYDIKDWDELRRQVGSQIDEFIKDYLTANPKLK